MKVGQKVFARWISKLAAQGAGRSQRKQSATVLREIDSELLRHVGGGTGGGSTTPTKGW
jgi:hypothetical protein